MASLRLYRKIGVSTLSQNLIHFAIRCHRENIWVLQLNIADYEKNIIVYYLVWGKVISKIYFLYTKDTHQIWCRSAKFLWKLKFCSGSGSGFYYEFQYQTYISYTEGTHQILFGSANCFESYCVHSKSPQTDRRTDRQTVRPTDRRTDGFFLLVLSSKPYKTWTFIKRREFFFSLMRLQ